MQIVDIKKQSFQFVDEQHYSSVVFERFKKLKDYESLMQQGATEALILKVLSVSRSTLYRWKRRYKQEGLGGLENDSRRPLNRRKQTWSAEQERRVLLLRREFPFWGKLKLSYMYKDRYGRALSVSMIGRIIKKLIVKGVAQTVRQAVGKREIKRRIFNGWAQPWKYGMETTKPGELVQIDHMAPRHYKGASYRHFRAVCPFTKITFGHVYENATARNGAHFLRYALGVFPFPILSIQVDGGNEFMGDFEALCEELKIPLFVLPPKSPELNGCVERGNGVVKTEFYSQYSGSDAIKAVQSALEKYNLFYNKVRPHQALANQPPLRYYENITKK